MFEKKNVAPFVVVVFFFHVRCLELNETRPDNKLFPRDRKGGGRKTEKREAERRDPGNEVALIPPELVGSIALIGVISGFAI